MAIGWFLAPYRRRAELPFPVRYCAVDEYTAQIRADGGTWSESECLGDHAVVKVRASNATLTAIAGDAQILRVPTAALTTTLGSLTANQRTALLNKVLALGYPQSEIDQVLGSGVALAGKTVADALRFVLRRRLKPRYDHQTDTIVCDGPQQWVKSLDVLDTEVV